ncbi:MAG: hypothetical protein Q9196_004824 [Gyalolechia fulgens]
MEANVEDPAALQEEARSQYLQAVVPVVGRQTTKAVIKITFSMMILSPLLIEVVLAHKLDPVPLGIPGGLAGSPLAAKSIYDQDTPQKSRDLPRHHQYGSQMDEFFPSTHLVQIKNIVDEVLDVAIWGARCHADEGHWSALTHLLLAEVATWPRAQRIRVLDTWV